MPTIIGKAALLQVFELVFSMDDSILAHWFNVSCENEWAEEATATNKPTSEEAEAGEKEAEEPARKRKRMDKDRYA